MITTKSGGTMVKRMSVDTVEPSEIFKGKPIDGAYFRKSKEPEVADFSVDFIRFEEAVKLDHSTDIGADNWIILLFEDLTDDPKFNYDVVYFHSYILDPLNFMKNQMNAGSQGVMIKRSMPGYKIITDVLKDLDLDDIKGQVLADIERFKKTYN